MFGAQAIATQQFSNPNYLNLEYFFYKVYLFFSQPETFGVNFGNIGSTFNTIFVLLILLFVAVKVELIPVITVLVGKYAATLALA